MAGYGHLWGRHRSRWPRQQVLGCCSRLTALLVSISSLSVLPRLICMGNFDIAQIAWRKDTPTTTAYTRKIHLSGGWFGDFFYLLNHISTPWQAFHMSRRRLWGPGRLPTTPSAGSSMAPGANISLSICILSQTPPRLIVWGVLHTGQKPGLGAQRMPWPHGPRRFSGLMSLGAVCIMGKNWITVISYAT